MGSGLLTFNWFCWICDYPTYSSPRVLQIFFFSFLKAWIISRKVPLKPLFQFFIISSVNLGFKLVTWHTFLSKCQFYLIKLGFLPPFFTMMALNCTNMTLIAILYSPWDTWNLEKSPADCRGSHGNKLICVGYYVVIWALFLTPFYLTCQNCFQKLIWTLIYYFYNILSYQQA